DATTAVRRSGKQLGTALSSLVNFLNPSAVVLGGALSGVDAYVAAVRSAIYDSSLAMTTQQLLIETTAAGSDAALIGLTRIARRSTPLPLPDAPSNCPLPTPKPPHRHSSPSPHMTALPRIALAGIAIESSTFTPYRSSATDFEVRRGTPEILDRFPFFTDGSETGRQLREAAEYVGVLHARALPGGQLDRGAYEGWKAEIVDGLAAAVEEAPLDGFFFDLHGAMSVVGLDDAEGDLIRAIRAVIGPGTVVGTAMDLHGNVSHTLFEACDLMTCYRHAPHIDAWETRERGLRD